MVFGNVSSITLCTSRDVRMTAECQMVPLLTVLALWNAWVHIYTTNSSDILSNVKSIIDNVLYYGTTLRILDVYPNHCHIRLGRCFDDTRF